LLANPKDGKANATVGIEDIYGMHISARLSVLSACETAIGAYQKGEGNLSLARGFAWAGSPAIVMTRWAVSDQSSTDITLSFYEQLQKGLSVPEALRVARLNYLENVTDPQMAHPAFWAAHATVGLPDPLFKPTSESSDTRYWMGFLLLISLFLIGYLAFGKSK